MCGPQDLILASKHLEKQLGGFISRHLASNIKRRILEHTDCIQMIEEAHKIDVDHVLNECKSLKDVDHFLTAKVFGYTSADDYYSSVGVR